MADHECSMKLELNNNLELRHQQPGVEKCIHENNLCCILALVNVGNDSDCSISVTLEYLKKSLQMSLVAYLCIFSIDVIAPKVCGALTTAAYSKIGLIRLL